MALPLIVAGVYVGVVVFALALCRAAAEGDRVMQAGYDEIERQRGRKL